MADGTTLSSVRNAARVLKAFTSRHCVYGVSELARKLDLSTSTVHRLLTTLASEHLIEQDPETGKYRLGLAIYELTAAVTTGFDLSHAVLPPMTVLRNQTGETVQIAVLDHREVVYVERLDSPHSLRLFLEVGRRNWAHCTGTGKLLLAFLPETELDWLLDGWQLPAVTPMTITDHGVLRKELREIRDRGYARNTAESELGVISISAPIAEPSGRVIAAMSVAGPSSRIGGNLDAITRKVIEAASVASQRLGYKGEGTR